MFYLNFENGALCFNVASKRRATIYNCARRRSKLTNPRVFAFLASHSRMRKIVLRMCEIVPSHVFLGLRSM